MSESIPSSSQPTRDRSGAYAALTGLSSLIGLAIVASPFVFDATDTGLWHHVAVGAIIFLLAGIGYYQVMTGRPVNLAVMGLAALLGLWMVIAPFAVDVGVDELLWTSVIAGLAVFLFTGYVAYMGRSRRAGIARPSIDD